MRVNGGLTVIDLLYNKLDAEAAKMLAEVAKQKGISLCGIQRDQTTADFSHKGFEPHKRIEPPDAILLASDLSQAVVTGGLTALDLSSNDLKDEGASAVCKAIQSNKETKLASLNVKKNGIGSIGANAVAAMVAVTGALTRVDVCHNNIAGNGAAQISAAVLGNLKIEMFNEIPIKEMRADSFTELDLMGKRFGVEGGMVVAGLIPVMGALTKME
jgi:Ran GTPase-activating protein (RanGAP) involved in mRNA processing and transport